MQNTYMRVRACGVGGVGIARVCICGSKRLLLIQGCTVGESRGSTTRQRHNDGLLGLSHKPAGLDSTGQGPDSAHGAYSNRPRTAQEGRAKQEPFACVQCPRDQSSSCSRVWY